MSYKYILKRICLEYLSDIKAAPVRAAYPSCNTVILKFG